jgi:hypothetical protein
MAVGAFTLLNTGKEALTTDNANQINWVSDTIVGVLVTQAHTPALTHSTYADISANITADANYAPAVVTGKTCVRTADKILWDCDNVSFGDPVTITAKYLYWVKRAGGALTGTDQLIGYVDLNVGAGLSGSSTNSLFRVNTPDGLFEI